MNISPSDIYTYELQNDIDGIIDASTAPFLVLGVDGDEAQIIPMSVINENYYDEDKVYVLTEGNGVEYKLCFHTDVIVQVDKTKLIAKIGNISNKLMQEVVRKSKNASIIYDEEQDIQRGEDTGEIEISDNDIFVSFLQSSAKRANIAPNILATDKCYVLASEKVYLDDPKTSLYIPIIMHGVSRGVIKLIFVSGDDKIDYRIKTSIEEDIFVIKCYNFEDDMGTCTIEPILVGYVNDKKVTIAFGSALHGDSDIVRTVDYTIFWEK